MALKPPVEVPQGAIRYNTDSQKLEFYAQDQWWQMATDFPTLDGGARALFGGGETPGGTNVNTIGYITIPTTGNSQDFGDLTGTRGEMAGGIGSRTRGLFGGGDGQPTYSNVIDYVTISTKGNAADFGDLVKRYQSYGNGSAGNSTRGLWYGNRDPDNSSPFSASYNNYIDYVTIAKAANSQDFGDLSHVASVLFSFASSTRAFALGGYTPSQINTCDYINITSLGNGQDFGDLNIVWGRGCGCSNSVRGVFGCGEDANSLTNNLDYLTMSTLGTTQSFGQLITLRGEYPGAVASPTRAVFGGTNSPSNNAMEYVSIMTTGDAIDFGDLEAARSTKSSLSNAHGGL